jgi:hypothetical protein
MADNHPSGWTSKNKIPLTPCTQPCSSSPGKFHACSSTFRTGPRATADAAAAHNLRVYRRSNLDDEASSPHGLAYLISSHFFEHVLDFIYIVLLILAAGA